MFALRMFYILVIFKVPYSLWDLIDVERFLSRELYVRVELASKDRVKPVLWDRILSEAARLQVVSAGHLRWDN